MTRSHAVPVQLLALLSLSLPGVGAAEEFLSDPYNFPARFSVAGVAPDDVLNLRAAPSADAPIVGELAPDATGVEVIDFSDDGAWALVPLPEGIAWASRRFLEIEADDGSESIPFPLRCAGTEPFWSLTVTEESASWEAMDDAPRRWTPVGEAMSYDGFVIAYDNGGTARDLTVMRRECTDGMSDRPYGWAALIWDREESVQEGCCFLLPR